MESRGMLYLDNLRSLDRDIAGHLSLYDGGISLGGLEHIDLGVLKLLL
ncbi:hypothetical protein IKI14_00240 [bacterium]|nr:hypothetical protein [bacterium]